MAIYGDFELYRKERRNGTVPTFQEFVRYLVSFNELVSKNVHPPPQELAPGEKYDG